MQVIVEDITTYEIWIMSLVSVFVCTLNIACMYISSCIMLLKKEGQFYKSKVIIRNMVLKAAVGTKYYGAHRAEIK